MSEPITPPADPKPAATRIAPPSILHKDTDSAARPGFRNPANSKSKAQKKKR